MLPCCTYIIMQITSLVLRSYRNYEEMHLDFDSGVQIFLGANAQGKTNIIEALYYAALDAPIAHQAMRSLFAWGK